MALDVHWADQARFEMYCAVKNSDHDDFIFSNIVLGLMDLLEINFFNTDVKALPQKWNILIQDAERIQQGHASGSLFESKENRYEMLTAFAEYVIEKVDWS